MTTPATRVYPAMNEVPPDLYTESDLHFEGRRLKHNAAPRAWVHTLGQSRTSGQPHTPSRNRTPLYVLADSEAIPGLSPTDRERLADARRCTQCLRFETNPLGKVLHPGRAKLCTTCWPKRASGK